METARNQSLLDDAQNAWNSKSYAAEEMYPARVGSGETTIGSRTHRWKHIQSTLRNLSVASAVSSSALGFSSCSRRTRRTQSSRGITFGHISRGVILRETLPTTFLPLQKLPATGESSSVMSAEEDPTQGVDNTPTAHNISSSTVVAQSRCSLVVIVYSHTLTPMRLHGSSHEARCLRFAHKTFTPHPRRAMSYTLQNLTPRTGTPSSPFPESVFQQPEQPCENQRPQQSGTLTELPPLTVYEPDQIAEDRDYRHFTGDGQFTEHEDLRFRPLSFLHQSIIASTYDSAESIVTPHGIGLRRRTTS